MFDNTDIIFELLDGGVTKIESDGEYESGGCPTCACGAVTYDYVTITMTKYVIKITATKTNTGGYVLSDGWCNEFEPLTMDDIIKMFNIDGATMTEGDFVARVAKYMCDKFYSNSFEVKIEMSGKDWL